MIKKALILLSGGLDSATVLAMAKADGYDMVAMSFNYGQRHLHELEAAQRIAQKNNVIDHRIVTIDLRVFGGSALTQNSIAVPKDRSENAMSEGVPLTYVPARNTIFLSYALALAEVLEVRDIFIGVNAVDYSGYPDCRPEYIEAFEHMANLATRAASEGKILKIHTPLIHLTKAEIILKGVGLGVDYAETTSCYDPDNRGAACGHCDACTIRKKGFAEAHVKDPTPYAV